jgi:hypothetical protein
LPGQFVPLLSRFFIFRPQKTGIDRQGFSLARMIHEVLAPGMQNAGSPYPCAKMLLVIGEFHKRLRNGTEKKIVHDLPIHRYQLIQFRGDGEDHMKILDGKEILTAGLDPSLFL